MGNSELVVTVRVFSAKEKDRLLLFLQSPYAAGTADTANEMRLLRYIFEALQSPAQTDQLLESEAIYAALYPNRAYSAPTINNLATSLLKLVRSFMEAEMLQRSKRPMREYALITEFLNERGAVDLCAKYLKRLDRIQKDGSPWDDLDYLLNWRAEKTRSKFLGMHNQLTDDYNLQESLYALEKLSLVERLNALTAIFNQNRITPLLSPEEREHYLADLEQSNHLPFFQHPLVQLCRKALLFFHLDGAAAETEFEAFITLLRQSEEQLSLPHLKWLEAMAYNFCARRFSQEKYRNMLFDLFQRWIEPARLQSNEMVQASEVLSLVQTGIIGKQYEWVEKFLETYHHRIQGSLPSEDYYRFGRALLLFHTGEFDKARAIVVHLNFPEMNYKYMAKALEIKLFFETGEEDYDLVESKLNSLNVALHREGKLPKEKKKRYTQFVNFMMRIHRWRGQLDPDPKWLEKIREDVHNAQNTAEWRWLMQKLDQLSK